MPNQYSINKWLLNRQIRDALRQEFQKMYSSAEMHTPHLILQEWVT